jgi:hypothetical protein
MAMTPFRHYPENIVIATSSFKYVKLGAGFGSKGTTWIYGNPESIVMAAVTGVFTPTTRWDYWNRPREERLASEKLQPLYGVPVPMIG